MHMESTDSIPLFSENEFINKSCTFAQVYALAARLLQMFRQHNLTGPICLATGSRELVAAALLASLNNGPELLLPYSFSGRTLAEMQQRTNFTAAITDTPLDLPPEILLLQPDTNGFEHNTVGYFDPENPLLRIFTGGSTGTPRIWAKTCGNIFHEAMFLTRSFQITEQDCIVATVPPYHIYGLLFSVVLPLVSGASVVPETPSFPGEILQTIQKNRGTILAAVPAHYRALRHTPLTGLRLAFSSAGMLDGADNSSFQRQNSLGIVEVYGSTETGGIATRTRARGEDHFTPFAAVDWKIEAERLAVRSPYISPDLLLDGNNFFLTADRVAACGDNGFLLLGRADSVVKVGGKRVDLDEIRTVLKRLPGVTDCVVLALEEKSGRERSIAALIEGTAEQGKLKADLIDRFESWSLPRTIKRVDQIPLLNNGKYDRTAIRRLLEA